MAVPLKQKQKIVCNYFHWLTTKMHTFEIPIHDYPMDRLVLFWANVIYNENGMHASILENAHKFLVNYESISNNELVQNVSYIANTPCYCALFTCCRRLICLALNTLKEFHKSAIMPVKFNHWREKKSLEIHRSIIWFRQIAQLSTTMSKIKLI